MGTRYIVIKIKKLILEQNRDYKGIWKELAIQLGVSPQSLSMALTGYRESARSQEILEDLLSLLTGTTLHEQG